MTLREYDGSNITVLGYKTCMTTSSVSLDHTVRIRFYVIVVEDEREEYINFIVKRRYWCKKIERDSTLVSTI